MLGSIFPRTAWRLAPAFALLAVLTLLPFPTLAAPGLSIRDLGPVEPGDGLGVVAALGINNRGQVVGQIHGPSVDRHAARWDEGSVLDLGTLPDARESAALAVNAAGQVAGQWFSGGRYGQARAVRWEHGVPTVIVDAESAAFGMNQRGHVVGASNATGEWRAFLWRGGTPVDLGVLGVANGMASSFAFAINERDQVVGHSLASDGATRPFLWQAGRMTALPTLSPNGSGSARAIDQRGRVAGSSQAGPRGDFRAVVWQDGLATDLGTLPGHTNSHAFGINARGQVVGTSTGDLGQDARAVLWEDGRAIDLNSVLPAGSPWTLIEAHGVSDRGEIVGVGTLDGQRRGFLLAR